MEFFPSHRNRSTNIRSCSFILFVIVSFMRNGYVDCRKLETVEHKNVVIKTIKGDGDDLIDCVDIYKQPALNHPLLQNHTIQLIPPPYPSGRNETESIPHDDYLQTWSLNGECPEGTIPILRSQGFNNSVPKTITPFNGRDDDLLTAHEYATANLFDGQYYGAHAYLNVWNPLTVDGEISLSQIWVVGGEGKSQSTVESGWIVDLPDQRTRFFIFWTGHGYQDGCYNHNCPGFVQVSRKYALGTPIIPTSVYNGKQNEIFISIYKHQSVGQWWVLLNDEPLGYFPDKILPSLRGSADKVSWGGEIYNSEKGGHHTTTQMGSGHFPSEGLRRASYVRNMQYLASSGKFVDASLQALTTYVPKPSCYSLFVKNTGSNFGTHFYYGGPGYSAICPK